MVPKSMQGSVKRLTTSVKKLNVKTDVKDRKIRPIKKLLVANRGKPKFKIKIKTILLNTINTFAVWKLFDNHWKYYYLHS